MKNQCKFINDVLHSSHVLYLNDVLYLSNICIYLTVLVSTFLCWLCT